VTLGDLPDDERPAVAVDGPWASDEFTAAIRRGLRGGAGLKEISEAAAEVAVDVALEDSGGSVRRASESLGVTPRALQLRAARRRMRLVADDRHGACTSTGSQEIGAA
jgi:hypothetical protein